MYQLAYISKARRKFIFDELMDLSERAAEKNEAIGVTGILTFNSGIFFQYLEGGQQQVENLFESIKRDDRHDICNLVHLGDSDERLFSSWYMRYFGVDELTEIGVVDVLASVVDQLSEPITSKAAVHGAIKLLTEKISQSL